MKINLKKILTFITCIPYYIFYVGTFYIFIYFLMIIFNLLLLFAEIIRYIFFRKWELDLFWTWKLNI